MMDPRCFVGDGQPKEILAIFESTLIFSMSLG